MSCFAPTGEIKISLIVPIYAAEDYLKRCVDSLIKQTFTNTEIILVDDGSPDRCPAMCDAYAAADNRIKVIHKKNGGLISAWQAGVKESAGDYLCFVDSDDWIEPDMLKNMITFTDQASAFGKAGEIICCNFVIDRGDPGVSRETKHYHGLPPGTYEGERLEGEIKDNLLGNENRTVSMSRCMKLFSRELIENNMHFCNPKVTMGEDVSITLPALLDCRRLVIMEESHYYHYFYNSASMVHKYDRNMYDGLERLYSNIQEIFRAKGRDSGEIQGSREYIYLLFLALKNELRGGQPGYADRIKKICTREKNAALIKNYPVTVNGKAERLLYLLLKKPKLSYIRAVKIMFNIYDRMN